MYSEGRGKKWPRHHVVSWHLPVGAERNQMSQYRDQDSKWKITTANFSILIVKYSNMYSVNSEI